MSKTFEQWFQDSIFAGQGAAMKEALRDSWQAARAQGEGEAVAEVVATAMGTSIHHLYPFKPLKVGTKLYTQPPSGVQPIAKALGEFMSQTPDEHWIVASAWKKGDYLSEVTVQHMGSEPKECAQPPSGVPEGWSLKKVEGGMTTITITRKSDGAWCGGGIKGDSGGAGVRYEFLDALLSTNATPPQPVPDWVYDGYAVYSRLSEKAKSRTSPENVSDTLDAIKAMLTNPPEQGGE